MSSGDSSTFVTPRMPEGKPELLPKMAKIRQEFERPRVEDLEKAVYQQLTRVFPDGSIKPNARIGITAGSRGISNIAEIVRCTVNYLRHRGADPFIIPAMGSHGGASAEGQKHLIEHYGVTEEACGAKIMPEMTTVSLGVTNEGVEAFLAKVANDSDGILLMNRIKPHTDYRGEIESGLTKISGIGLGKLQGAQEYHSHVFGLGLGGAIRSATSRVIEQGKILGGLGILENAYHETAKLAGVTVDGFFAQEAELLKEAKALMPRLPIADVHVLLCDYMGKNISGAGVDTNIINRSVRGYQDVSGWQESHPVVRRVIVNNLTPESDGNAVGMGFVDFITEKFRKQIDYYATSLNGITACCPQAAKTPVVLKNTLQALSIAIQTCGRDKAAPKLVYIRDTLSLNDVYVSEACLPELSGKPRTEILTEPAPLEFDSEGFICSPYDTH